jgi:sialate O-acetylesterase
MEHLETGSVMSFRRLSITIAIALGATLALAGSARAPAPPSLRVSRLIGDHMVLQRDTPLLLWGWVEPGNTVRVAVNDRSFVATTAADGGWQVRLPAMPAGGPHTLTFTSGAERIRASDVLVGDVWICSGQSNMEWTVADSKDAAREIASATDGAIRQFKVPQSWSERPESELTGGTWEVADSAHVATFTAVGYFFARDLRKHVRVPIGLINTTWGGSGITPWMSRQALALDDAAFEAIMRRERDHERRLMEALRTRLGTVPTRDEGLVDGVAHWAAPALDEAAWSPIEVPKIWESQGYDGLDGVAWYRTTFTLSDVEARSGIRLGLGMIDDGDITWVNGVEIGRTDGWNRTREYDVPSSVLRTGPNVLAIRVQDWQGGGGIHGSQDLVYLSAGGARRSLGRDWRFRVGAVMVGTDGQRINKIPTVLYNRMVHPMLRYRVKGALWYQGESNANTVDDALAYRSTFADLITSWRREWKSDMPFLWVQLASFMAPDTTPPATSGWATLRESQSAALTLPRTAQVIAIDVGDADDIHPRNKQDVGARLALAARRVGYGQNVVHSGPVYRAHEMRGDRIAIEFDHVAGGLVAHGGDRVPRGFAIAAEDRKFVWAQARIEGRRVIVWSERVARPVAVRYAWGNNPDQANLYSDAGLPAAPFRTDRW